MAMHDTRWFRNGASWWVARVFTASSGVSMSGPAPFTHEGVLLRELRGFDDDIQVLECTLPAGSLNRVTHSTLVRALGMSRPASLQVYFGPANIPFREELQGNEYEDDEGLKWVYRIVTIPILRSDADASQQAAAEFICLDDSALRGVIALTDAATLDDLVKAHGAAGIKSVIGEVKRSFKDLPDEQLQQLQRLT